MFLLKSQTNNTRTKAPRWVQGTTGKLNANHLSDEERQTNTNRCNERRAMLLLGEHEDGKHQLSRQDRLDEDTLDQGRAPSERGPHVEGLGEEMADNHGREHGAEHLRDEETDGSGERDGFDHGHGQGHCRVEETAADAEEDPNVDHEREAEAQGDVEKCGNIETSCCTRGGVFAGA